MLPCLCCWNIIWFIQHAFAVKHIERSCVVKLETELWLMLQIHITHYIPGPWFNIKMTSYQYRKSHCGDKTILRPSYLHNGISYTDKMTSLYWIRAQAEISIVTVFLPMQPVKCELYKGRSPNAACQEYGYLHFNRKPLVYDLWQHIFSVTLTQRQNGQHFKEAMFTLLFLYGNCFISIYQNFFETCSEEFNQQ